MAEDPNIQQSEQAEIDAHRAARAANLFDVRRINRGNIYPSPKHIACGIPANPSQPITKLVRPSKLLQLFARNRKARLSRIFSQTVLAQRSITYRNHRLVIPPVKLTEAVNIAVHRPGDQLCICQIFCRQITYLSNF